MDNQIEHFNFGIQHWTINCVALLENLDYSKWKNKQGTDHPIKELYYYTSLLYEKSLEDSRGY